MIPFLETERLSLRQFHPSDADNLYRLHRDRRVMRYIGDGSVGDRASVAAVLARAAREYRNYPGLGAWPAAERASGEFVGWFCLKYVPKTVEVELGYRLLPQAWGYGYATEGARELVRYAFEVLGLHRIIGLTHPGNTASQSVLRKAGLRDAGWGHYYDRELRLFVASGVGLGPETGLPQLQDLP
ncbi:MAG TPA: GNAT family N-acetyltransferase [Casimicrobiaceae bacterium]|nr:GNAT family N-acetyltransferase [Casimicrobiaceae bacterium]